MAKSERSKRDEKRELSRRALFKWTVAAGAALGVTRSKVFNILNDKVDPEIAYAAAAAPTTRSVHLVGGNGGQSWFTLFWPHNDIAAGATPSNTLAWHKPGQQMLVAGTDNPLTIGPDTPWQSLPAQNQVTCFTCGGNETHTRQPKSTVDLNGNNIFSVASALQAQSPAVIPIITIGDVDIGSAAGGQKPSNVGDGPSIVGLFNSAASRMGGLLANANDAALYKQQYESFFALQSVAGLSTTRSEYLTADGAAKFLGTNLATQLQTSQADLTRYGVDGSTKSNIQDIANVLIVAVKAFRMGLTNCIVLPAMDDDPHGAFDQGDVNTVPAAMKLVFDGFMNDLQNTVDDSGTALSDDTVITFHGDTPKDCTNKVGWVDGTISNSNEVFVYSAGNLKTGRWGAIDRNGKITGYQSDGTPTPGQFDNTGTANIAMASIAYAIAKRDDRQISQFANGLTISGIFGNPKDN